MGLGPWRVAVVVRSGRPLAQHRRPEVLHLTEVPQEVVGVPVRAARHPGLRVARGEDVAEARRLVLDVVAVVVVGQSRHAANLGPRADPVHPGYTPRFMNMRRDV